MIDLNVRGVSFSHRASDILRGITFGISGGEVMGIVGENGSGKTTLLKCINTEYRPTGGSVMLCGFDAAGLDGTGYDVDGTDVRGFSDSDRSRLIATVEQNSQQSFPFTVMETVRMGRYSRTGMFDDDDESELDTICSVMEDTGILGFADRSVAELSGGEWRRVMIAQALAQEPKVLLLDEPTLHLDVCHQFDLMDLCRRIVSGRDVAVIIVTHDLQLAARYCDKVIVMDRGSIVAAGPSRDVITEDLIRRVFHMESRVSYDPELSGMSVKLIGRAR